MTLFERKAIDWLKSLDNPLNPTDEGYYAQLILAMLEGLDEQSVSDLLSRIDELLNNRLYNDEKFGKKCINSEKVDN